MGKKRTAVIDGADQPTKKEKVMFRWEEAYNDLPIHLATVLREARVKPDQLREMADGEILALGGVSQDDLKEVHAKYPVAILAEEVEVAKEQEETKTTATPSKPASNSPRLKYPTKLYGRSKQYKAKKTKVENKSYSLPDAVALLKTISYGKTKTVELHLNVKETGIRGELSLPHSTGKQIKVAIFTPEIEKEIKAGKINFDILLATPKDMGAVAPLARVLGPKGLMPSPKNGTITDDPEGRAKKLQAGATLSYKTEPKAPLMHLSLGVVTQPDSELIGNITTVLNAIGANKILAAHLKSTMSPSIRLEVASL